MYNTLVKWTLRRSWNRLTHSKGSALKENGKMVCLKSAILAALEFILKVQLEATILSMYKHETGTGWQSCQLIMWTFQNQKFYLVAIIKGRELLLPKWTGCNSALNWAAYHILCSFLFLGSGWEEGLDLFKTNLFVLLCIIQMLITSVLAVSS